MMDRYENSEIALDLNERTTSKFVSCAKDIYLQLAQLQQDKKINLNEQFTMIVTAVSDLSQLLVIEEKYRGKFIVPDVMHEDYLFAKNRVKRMRDNPEHFHNEESSKRVELEKVKNKLANQIKDFEVEYAREEDERRLEANNDRARITSEMAYLKFKKKKYEDRAAKGLSRCLPICGRGDAKKITEMAARLKELEAELRGLGTAQYRSLDEKRRQLEELRKRRWNVDKALTAQENALSNKTRRWQNAISNAEIVMLVRRLDIDAEMNRHYSSVGTQTIHALLNVFALVKSCVDQAGKNASMLSDEMETLSGYATALYCPTITNRTVTTLYRKMMEKLPAADRNQIINSKPVRDHLPAALLQTFSVKNFKDTASSLALFRKVTANDETVPVVDTNKPTATPVVDNAPKVQGIK